MKHSKKILSAVLVLAVIASVAVSLAFCSKATEAQGICNIKAAVYSPEDKNDVLYNQLRYGIMANLDVTKITDLNNAAGYDIVYLDSGAEGINTSAIKKYVSDGGTVVLDNSFINEFDMKFLGAEDIVKIESMPFDMSYEYTGENLTKISELLYDYTSTIRAYTDFTDYWEYDYGYGIIPDTAKIIGGKDGVGIYTKNTYGKGDVFITTLCSRMIMA